ncbi:MAG: OmpA family protein [Brumimicrobium sp.]
MRLRNILLVLFIAVNVTILAQPVPSIVKKADAAYESGAYFEAAESLVSAYDRISPKNERALAMKAELAYKAGRSYELAFNDEKAAEWYQRAIDLEYYKDKPHVYFRLGGIFRKDGEYEKAKTNYQEFLKLVPEDKQAENALASLEKAEVLKDNRTRYTVKAEFKINDEGIDMAPVVASRRGNEFVFASSRKASVAAGRGNDPITGEGYMNLWQIEKDRSGNWTPPNLFDADSINTEHSEGTMAFDGRFRNAFITRCPYVKKKNLGCEIWVAEKRGRSWGLPKEVKIKPNDTISVGHPCPNEDGSTLIFASDLPGGQGGKDLWYTEYDRRSETWSTPVNLGPEINSSGDELFPTYASNGDLLFSSTGHEGLGGLDLFRAEKSGESMSFKKPENLGTPLNSDQDDYHLVETGKRSGLFTSNREGSRGNKNLPDIWSYELPPNIFDLKVIVSEVGSPVRVEGATVQVNPENGQAFKGVTDSQGSVFWDKKPDGDRFINEEENYTVTVLPLEGYHESNDQEQFTTVDLNVDQNFIIEMNLLPKTPIVLPEVRYPLGSAELLVEEGVIDSKDSLNYVHKLLEEYPGMVLKLVSHTDSRGLAKSNEKLAKERAQSCVDYLVNEKGVNPKRLVPEGKGEDQPRTVYLVNDSIYVVDKPASGDFETIELTEKYINQYKRDDKDLFEKLHQFNRRTEGEVVRMDFKEEEEKEEGEGEKEE